MAINATRPGTFRISSDAAWRMSFRYDYHGLHDGRRAVRALVGRPRLASAGRAGRLERQPVERTLAAVAATVAS